MMNIFIIVFISFLFVSTSAFSSTLSIYKKYCQKQGGKAEKMQVEYKTPDGIIKGPTNWFCNFYFKILSLLLVSKRLHPLPLP